MTSIALTIQAHAAQVIQPESATVIEMSNRDMNRIYCQNGAVNDVHHSEEKPVKITQDGKNAFVKFLIEVNPMTGEKKYASQSIEAYIVCDGAVYSLIMKPKNVNSKTVQLGSVDTNKIYENIKTLGSLPEEERALKLTLEALKDEMPESYTVKVNTTDLKIKVIPDTVITRRRDIKVDGLDLELTEYNVRAENDVQLHEQMFLNSVFGNNIFAVTIENHKLKNNQMTRLFIVKKQVLQ